MHEYIIFHPMLQIKIGIQNFVEELDDDILYIISNLMKGNEEKGDLHNSYFKIIISRILSKYIILNGNGFEETFDEKYKCLGYLYQLILRPYVDEKEWLLLHGGGICTNRGATIFLAPSGVGKTSTVKKLSEKCSFLSDDLIPVNIRNNSVASYPIAISHRVLNETKNSRKVLIKKRAGYEEKSLFQLQRAADINVMYPINKIILLNRKDDKRNIDISIVSGYDKIESLFDVLSEWNAHSLRKVVRFACNNEIYRISYPDGFSYINSLYDFIGGFGEER
jgi:hypothetical protein